MINLAAIVGPTAAGKTSISIRVARELNGEIISCDSMQIYKYMDIGTAKADKSEITKVRHHLIDIVEPDQEFSVADYQKNCKKAISEIAARGKLPILVGGTGLYYQAVVDDYEFFPMESMQRIRDKWNNVVKDRGLDEVYKYLRSVDEEYANKISPKDQKRIIRAIEVFELTGQTFSSLQRKTTDTYNLAVVGLYMERDKLYQKIERRVEDMLKNGLIEEVMQLKDKGYNLSFNSMQALGYKQVLCYLDGFISREEMINEIKRETRRYAKRQYTWFKKDKRIKWINIKQYDDADILAKKISAYIEGQLYKM